jgi:AraC-like DNA-binding protein
MLFKELLEENFRHQKSVAAYASKMSISNKRLNVATSKMIGSSQKKMINKLVILGAKRLLSHTNYFIKEISSLLGFKEPTNFTKFLCKFSYNTLIKFRKQL